MGFLISYSKTKESSTPDIKKIEGMKGINKKKFLVILIYKINYKDGIENGIAKCVCWICD